MEDSLVLQVLSPYMLPVGAMNGSSMGKFVG